MHPYHKEGREWAKWLSGLSDEKLVATHNDAVGRRYFGFARQMYLRCLMQEIITRNFDSSILFECDAGGNRTSYLLSKQVVISVMGNQRILVAKTNHGETR